MKDSENEKQHWYSGYLHLIHNSWNNPGFNREEAKIHAHTKLGTLKTIKLRNNHLLSWLNDTEVMFIKPEPILVCVKGKHNSNEEKNQDE